MDSQTQAAKLDEIQEANRLRQETVDSLEGWYHHQEIVEQYSCPLSTPIPIRQLPRPRQALSSNHPSPKKESFFSGWGKSKEKDAADLDVNAFLAQPQVQ